MIKNCEEIPHFVRNDTIVTGRGGDGNRARSARFPSPKSKTANGVISTKGRNLCTISLACPPRCGSGEAGRTRQEHRAIRVWVFQQALMADIETSKQSSPNKKPDLSSPKTRYYCKVIFHYIYFKVF